MDLVQDDDDKKEKARKSTKNVGFKVNMKTSKLGCKRSFSSTIQGKKHKKSVQALRKFQAKAKKKLAEKEEKTIKKVSILISEVQKHASREKKKENIIEYNKKLSTWEQIQQI